MAARKHPPPEPWTALRNLRLDANLTLTDLAERTGLSLPYVCQLEKGTRGPSVGTLNALAEVFGVKPSELDATTPAVPSRKSTCAAGAS